MASRQPFIIFCFLFLLFFPSPSVSAISPSSIPSRAEFLTVPVSVFSGNVESAIDKVQRTLSILSKVTGKLGNFRLTNAIRDCNDLLAASSDVLKWTLDATAAARPSGAGGVTGNSGSDLKAWLSAALAHLDTCLDGFDGTNGAVKGLVSGSVHEVSSLIAKMLKMVRTIPSKRSAMNGGLPEWVTPRERRLLQAPVARLTPYLTVAADGSGNFTSIMEAVSAMPEKSTRWFVIYIKKGVYRENVDIKKWNLVIIGDGMEATIISGNRSFADGWTTYRSATFGNVASSSLI